MVSDRVIGYIVLVAVSVFACVCIGTVAWVFFSPRETRIVSFDNIGSLKLDDPIRVAGCDVGQISSVSYKNGKALVAIESPKHLDIRADYRISMVDLGLMGDRAVSLECGSRGLPAVPLSDTLVGSFVIGPSEAIGLMYKLRETVVGFVTVSERLAKGNSRQASLIKQISQAISYVDTLTGVITSFTEDLDRNVSGELDSVTSLMRQTATLSVTMQRQLPATITSADSMVHRLSTVLVSLDTLLVEVRPIADSLTGPEARKFQEQIGALATQLNEIKELLGDLQDKGLPLKVRLF